MDFLDIKMLYYYLYIYVYIEDNDIYFNTLMYDIAPSTYILVNEHSVEVLKSKLLFINNCFNIGIILI